MPSDRSELVLRDEADAHGTTWRAVRLRDDGGLAIVGHDLGRGLERVLGYREYEFERRLSAAETATLRGLLDAGDDDLLSAVKQRFRTTGELEAFVKEHGIPGAFWNRIGD